jgi:diguanylate cyclase (GGDEF)-like protein
MLTVYRNVRFDTMDQEYRVVRPDGSVRWVHQRGFPAHDIDGAVARVVGIIEDITERKQMQQDLLHLAHHDNLTHLPNRGLFYDRLSQALAQAHRHEWAVGVMFIDLDRFKIVNDTLGHGVGDLLLQQVAKRLSGCIRAEDTVARLGGDEFAVMLPDLADAQDAAAVARKILGALAAPFQLDGHEVFVTASIGIASYPRDSHDADTLIKHADAAMYRAKDLGKNNYQLYSALLSEQAPERLQLESNLRRALERNEFVLHFQPRANLVTGLITGVEALVRWQLPNGSLVAPADFIPLLEETGLIVPAGEWVLRAACAQVRTWQQDGLEPVPIAVNLSARQFHQQDICEVVTRALHDYAVDPRFLELEITESAAMKNAAEATKTLRALKAIGVHIAIDDFGTGYSSLGYLKRFPIDSLKLDRSFVTDLPDNEEDASIAQAVITMAHALKLKVIAEGVENEAQLAFLAAHGCNEMQGYHLSRPLPAAACTQFLRDRKKMASQGQLVSPPKQTLLEFV